MGGVAANTGLRVAMTAAARRDGFRFEGGAAGVLRRQRGDDRRGGGDALRTRRPQPCGRAFVSLHRDGHVTGGRVTDLPAAIPTPGSLLKKYGLSPRKSWGQNFLHDVRVHEEIVAASGAAASGRRVVEIGAGLGTLTMHLLASGAEVWAIERDRDLCGVLRAELGGVDRVSTVRGERHHLRLRAGEADGGAGGRGGEPALSDHGRAALRPARS